MRPKSFSVKLSGGSCAHDATFLFALLQLWRCWEQLLPFARGGAQERHGLAELTARVTPHSQLASPRSAPPSSLPFLRVSGGTGCWEVVGYPFACDGILPWGFRPGGGLLGLVRYPFQAFIRVPFSGRGFIGALHFFLWETLATGVYSPPPFCFIALATPSPFSFFFSWWSLGM